jgi:hypothetical protein
MNLTPSNRSCTMLKRPHTVAVIGSLFVVTGIVGLVYHAHEFNLQAPFRYDGIWVCLVRVLAIVFGVFTLRGRNWARWGLLGWMAFHVVLSAFHTPVELAVHGLLLGVIAYLLLRPQMSVYFGSPGAGKAPMPETSDKPVA